jgi:hypothetical protein
MKNIKFDYLVRNIEAENYLEKYLISAITSILVIRTFLAFTNYPQLGGEGLHIAHMLWGGLLMTMSLFGLLIFLNRRIKIAAAILGGVGFGVFIDELGKFITHDNNYFFQATIALIYIIFVFFYLFYRLFVKQFKATQKEYAANAIEIMRDVVLHDLDTEEKLKAKEYLEKSNPRDPIIKVLKKTLVNISAIPPRKKSFMSKLVNKFRIFYYNLIKSPRFAKIIISFFVLMTVLSMFVYMPGPITESSFTQWGLFLSSSLSGVFVLLGIYFLKRNSHTRAYEMFNIAVLVSIFLTQFFLLYKEQLSAITRLAVTVPIWMVLQNLIHQETLSKEVS